MLLVYYLALEHKLSKEKLYHYVDLVMVHYAEKTFVENEFKMSRVASI